MKLDKPILLAALLAGMMAPTFSYSIRAEASLTCEQVFALRGDIAEAERFAAEDQALARVLQTLQVVRPNLEAREIDTASAIQTIFDLSGRNVDETAKLITFGHVPGADIESAKGMKLGKAAERYMKTLEIADARVKGAKSIWGKALFRAMHPTMKIEKIVSRLKDDRASLDKLVLDVKAENQRLLKLQAKVNDAALLIADEGLYLRKLAEAFKREAEAMPEGSRSRVAIEKEVLPAIMKFHGHVASLEAVVSGTQTSIKQHLMVNTEVLTEANALTIGAAPSFMARIGPALGLNGSGAVESFESVKEFSDFCVSGGICRDMELVYKIPGQHWETNFAVAGVAPNGTLSLKGTGYGFDAVTAEMNEVGVTSPNYSIMGFRAGDRVAHKTESIIGTIYAITPGGIAIINNANGAGPRSRAPLAELIHTEQ